MPLKDKKGGIYNATHKYFLRGVVICGYCGKRMTGNIRYSGRNKSIYVTYRCVTNNDMCISKEINWYFLEDFVSKKENLKSEIAKKSQVRDIHFTDDDIKTTLEQCKLLLKQPSISKSRKFFKKFIAKIVIYRDEALIVLNTGLSVNDNFNTEIKATRDEIYAYGRSIKNAGWVRLQKCRHTQPFFHPFMRKWNLVKFDLEDLIRNGYDND